MGRILHVTFYENEIDIINDKGLKMEKYEEYQNIKFDSRADNFKGSRYDLYQLIMLLSHHINDENNWTIAITLKILWEIYIDFENWENYFVVIEYF